MAPENMAYRTERFTRALVRLERTAGNTSSGGLVRKFGDARGGDLAVFGRDRFVYDHEWESLN